MWIFVDITEEMKPVVVPIIILGVVSGLTHGSGLLPEDTMTAALEGTVRFNTNIPPPEKPFISVGWTLVGSEKNIITSSDVNTTGPEYEGRIILFRSTGSLELSNLFLHDSGDYRVTIVPSGGGAQLTGQTSLHIQESISDVIVTYSDTDLVEFNSSLSLSCSATGTSPSFRWLNGSSEVTDSERFQITDGGRSLTIVNVTRSDEGPFRCHVSNDVSNDTSDPVTFSISYGPDDIQKSPTQEHYLIGSEVLLTCSSVSSPPAHFNWFLNENPLPDTGPELKLTNVQEDQSGNYSCQAFNSKTLRYKRSQPSAINVVGCITEHEHLSLGAIAEIVIACLLVVGAALGGGFSIYLKRSNNPQSLAPKKEQVKNVYENDMVIYENNI